MEAPDHSISPTPDSPELLWQSPEGHLKLVAMDGKYTVLCHGVQVMTPTSCMAAASYLWDEFILLEE